MTRPAPLETWHRIAETRDAAALDVLLADDVVFRSPAVHTPQEGKAITTAYLAAAIHVLGPSLRYVEEWSSESEAGGSAVLEFEATVADKSVHGIDMLRWGADGRLTSFTVMVRPFKGLEALMGAMAAELARLAEPGA